MGWFDGGLRESNKFVSMLIAQAEKTLEGVRYLESMVDRVDAQTTESLRALAEGASELRRVLIDELHKTFITPLDRDEIHQLITGMDDILDLMEDVATSVFLYDVRAVTPDAQKLAEICVACTLKVKEAVGKLASMDNADAILGICGDIDRLESEADFVFRSALAKLFREESDAKQILRLKEVYQLLESITDKAEDVANVIEGIVLENA